MTYLAVLTQEEEALRLVEHPETVQEKRDVSSRHR